MDATSKPFSWSFSRLKNYRTCPKKHWHVDLAKDVKEPESEQLTWGNRLHEAMAKRISEGENLPTDMKRFDKWPSNVQRVADEDKVVVKTENKLAMTKDFEPCGFFDSDAWFRGVIDVLVLVSDRAAVTLDWKTGKIKPEYEQLALSAQLLFVHYPKLEWVETIYVWFGHNTKTQHRYHRSEMVETWNRLWPEIKQMELAHNTTTYLPKPSGICVNWCPVVTVSTPRKRHSLNGVQLCFRTCNR